MRRRHVLRCMAAALAVATAGSAGPAVAQSGDVLVFAAASLKNALDDVAAGWARQGGKPVKISYAASSALARQIDQGAPASIFISADLDWMDYVQQRSLVRADSRINLLGNRIVLIAPAASSAAVTIAPGFDLAGLLGDGRLAMGDVNAVPAGKYGKAALESLGVWASVQNRLAQAENVRAALLFVARREVPLGIVYRTDAAAETQVKVIGTFPENMHPPIVYPAALTRTATADAPAFFAHLRSAAARPHFEKQGFAVLD